MSDELEIQQALDSFHIKAAVNPLVQEFEYLREFNANARLFLDALDDVCLAVNNPDPKALHDEHLQRVVNIAQCCYASARALHLPTDPTPLLSAVSGDSEKEVRANWNGAIDTIYKLSGDANGTMSRLWTKKVDATKVVVGIIERRWRKRAGELESPPAKPAPVARNHRQKKARKLTGKQLEAVQAFGECECNYSATARKMGLSLSAARDRVRAGYKKLGQAVPTKPGTQALPLDRRGGSSISDSHDRRKN